ncbi:hypothetical protein RF11_01204 [Thelohanellus kitauei]|uniref:Uncharacterized protein n=1 Tax=Thelohanellus kitauei TaxID=669202 RepID=A0A0C2IW48_THEKT|nr:hypothetical protein RF11_01204 [Thelohanellus kitauei]
MEYQENLINQRERCFICYDLRGRRSNQRISNEVSCFIVAFGHSPFFCRNTSIPEPALNKFSKWKLTIGQGNPSNAEQLFDLIERVSNNITYADCMGFDRYIQNIDYFHPYGKCFQKLTRSIEAVWDEQKLVRYSYGAINDEYDAGFASNIVKDDDWYLEP